MNISSKELLTKDKKQEEFLKTFHLMRKEILNYFISGVEELLSTEEPGLFQIFKVLINEYKNHYKIKCIELTKSNSYWKTRFQKSEDDSKVAEKSQKQNFEEVIISMNEYKDKIKKKFNEANLALMVEKRKQKKKFKKEEELGIALNKKHEKLILMKRIIKDLKIKQAKSNASYSRLKDALFGYIRQDPSGLQNYQKAKSLDIIEEDVARQIDEWLQIDDYKKGLEEFEDQLLLKEDSATSDVSSLEPKDETKKAEQRFNVKVVRERKICNFLDHKSHSTSKLHDKKMLSIIRNFMGYLTFSFRDNC